MRDQSAALVDERRLGDDLDGLRHSTHPQLGINLERSPEDNADIRPLHRSEASQRKLERRTAQASRSGAKILSVRVRHELADFA